MGASAKVIDDYFQINIPIREAYENPSIKRYIDLLRAKEIISKSQASDEEIIDFAQEVKRDWWEKNKDRFQR